MELWEMVCLCIYMNEVHTLGSCPNSHPHQLNHLGCGNVRTQFQVSALHSIKQGLEQ